MVEPSFLALTSTPSIAPSSLEETCPLSAVCAEAPIVNGIASTQARLTVLKSALRRMVVLSLDDLAPCWHISESRDRGVARMKRSAMRGGLDGAERTPDFASLHPGYKKEPGGHDESTCADLGNHCRNAA